MMKVVIVGGGIAGLTLGILLRQKNIEVVINERLANMPERGHAFLMHADGLAILKELNTCNKPALQGKMIDASPGAFNGENADGNARAQHRAHHRRFRRDNNFADTQRNRSASNWADHYRSFFR